MPIRYALSDISPVSESNPPMHPQTRPSPSLPQLLPYLSGFVLRDRCSIRVLSGLIYGSLRRCWETIQACIIAGVRGFIFVLEQEGCLGLGKKEMMGCGWSTGVSE